MPKVIDIKSEILFRSAEDDFFYFHKINSAYRKLKEAVKLTPGHFKTVIFLANIAFIKGYIKKALNLYLKAEKINNNNIKVFAYIANCYFNLNDFEKAVFYCNKVILLSNDKTYCNFEYEQNYNLLIQIFELKIKILIYQKNYKQAYETLKKVKNLYGCSYLNLFQQINYDILNKKINLQKKIQKSNLKIV